MSFPEIDKRCETCGATVRRRARFCPYCGGDMSDEKIKTANDEADRADASNEKASHDARPLESKVEADETSLNRDESSHEVPPTREAALMIEPPPTREIKVSEQRAETVRPLAYSPAIFSALSDEDKRPTRLDKFQRAASNALAEGKQRAVTQFGENKKADDAGARFVLIAAALFVVALALFIFSAILK